MKPITKDEIEEYNKLSEEFHSQHNIGEVHPFFRWPKTKLNRYLALQKKIQATKKKSEPKKADVPAKSKHQQRKESLSKMMDKEAERRKKKRKERRKTNEVKSVVDKHWSK